MYGMCWSGLYVYMHTWSQSVLTLRWSRRILKSSQHMETKLIHGTDVTDRSEISASRWRSILSEKITLPQITTSCCLRVATHKHIDPCFQNGYYRKIAPSSTLHGYYVNVYSSLKGLCTHQWKCSHFYSPSCRSKPFHGQKHLKNILFCFLQKEESHTGLKQHEGE